MKFQDGLNLVLTLLVVCALLGGVASIIKGDDNEFNFKAPSLPSLPSLPKLPTIQKK